MDDDTKELTPPKQIYTPYEAQPTLKPSIVQRGLQAIGLAQKRNGAVWKDADGFRNMLIITSNAYEDREGETIKKAALKEWVEGQWVDDTYTGNNPLLFWHDNRVKMGEIVFSDLSGDFLIEIAKEDDNLLAEKLWDYAETVQEGGASHGFWAWTDETDETVFEHIDKQETSWLPREAAANELTYAGVLPVDKAQVFDKAVGLDGASKLLDNGIEVLMEALKKRGVQSKARKTSAQDERMYLEMTKAIGELATSEGIMSDPKKATKFEKLFSQYQKMYGDEAKAEELPDEEEMKEDEEVVIEEEVKELVIEDVRALMEEYLAPITEALSMLMEGRMVEEAAKSKAKNMPRMAKRASQSDDTIIELDLANAPQSIKAWQNETEDFFGRAISKTRR